MTKNLKPLDKERSSIFNKRTSPRNTFDEMEELWETRESPSDQSRPGEEKDQNPFCFSFKAYLAFMVETLFQIKQKVFGNVPRDQAYLGVQRFITNLYRFNDLPHSFIQRYSLVHVLETMADILLEIEEKGNIHKTQLVESVLKATSKINLMVFRKVRNP